MNAILNDNLFLALLVPAILGLLAFVWGVVLYLTVRRMRRDQRVILGEGGGRDMVAHARALEQQIASLNYDINQVRKQLEQQNLRLDDCFTYRSVVRYDAYHDLSGMQSTSVCLLDTRFSGIVISSIQSRDHARIYVREIRHGESREQLSPEEIHVLKEAMGLKALERHPKTVKGGRLG